MYTVHLEDQRHLTLKVSWLKTNTIQYDRLWLDRIAAQTPHPTVPKQLLLNDEAFESEDDPLIEEPPLAHNLRGSYAAASGFSAFRPRTKTDRNLFVTPSRASRRARGINRLAWSNTICFGVYTKALLYIHSSSIGVRSPKQPICRRRRGFGSIGK